MPGCVGAGGCLRLAAVLIGGGLLAAGGADNWVGGGRTATSAGLEVGSRLDSASPSDACTHQQLNAKIRQW